MGKQKLHLHSMMVHAIIALAPLATAAYILMKLEIGFFVFNPATWRFLVVFALPAMLVISIPAALSGIFERGHNYVNWHSTHKIKLVLTILLWIFLIVELIFIFSDGASSGLVIWLVGLLVIGNNIIVFFLSANGLKITMGRQSWGGASYQPDLFKPEPEDILVSAGALKQEEPKYLDLLKER